MGLKPWVQRREINPGTPILDLIPAVHQRIVAAEVFHQMVHSPAR